jgi:hypothetical protein
MSIGSDRAGNAVRFVLPRLSYAQNTSGLLSFRKESAQILGLLVSGGLPVVFDPISLANETPRATLIHEEMHQYLMLNTSFGVFHQRLEHFAEVSDDARRACRVSLEEQWSVQELLATYTEMIGVARWYPQLLEGSITRMPSEILDEPPYREVYDSFAQYLPVHSSTELSLLLAQQILLQYVAGWSMSNDCLVHFANPRAFSIGGFHLYLERESPHRRFERLMSVLLSTGALWALLERIAARTAGADPIIWLIPEFSSLLGESCVSDIELLKEQVQTLESAWSDAAGISETLRNSDPAEPIPVIMAVPSIYHDQVKAFQARATLTSESLRSQLAAIRSTDLGVFFAFATDGCPAKVHLGTYLRGEGVLPSIDSSNEGFKPIDLWGVLPAEDVCRTLEESRPSPHILIFRGIGTWRWWRDRPKRGDDPESSIWVCSEALMLSLECVRDLLEFRNIGSGAQYLPLRFPDTPFMWGFIVNLSTPGDYVMIDLHSEAGLKPFKKIAEVLGIKPLKQQIESAHVRALLNMLMIVEV